MPRTLRRRTDLILRLKALAAARMLRAGGLVAHGTSTVPGVAASPWRPAGLARIMRFKGRPGPFLVLADSAATARALALYFTPELRRLMRESWPGRTTLVFRARPVLPACCYRRGQLAVRVDADAFVRAMAHQAGGLVLSSSLNRRGQVTAPLERRLRWRWHRHLDALLPGEAGAGTPSTMLRVGRRRIERLR